MAQLSLFTPPSWTVSDVNRYLRQMLENDSQLQDLWVQGEISNFSRPASGHLYFTLKDSNAALKCVIWRSDAQRIKLPLRDGLAVEVHGKVNIYEAGGQLQLYADLIRPAGEGRLYQEFLRLKAMLEAEGLFDPSRKRPLPLNVLWTSAGQGSPEGGVPEWAHSLVHGVLRCSKALG